MRVCNVPGCPELTDKSRCAQHRLPEQRRTRTAAHHGQRWRDRSTSFRRRHPQCVVCATTEHTEADHVVARQLLVAAGVGDPDADAWLQTLCRRHHGAKTRLVDQPHLDRLAAGEPAQQLCEQARRAAADWLAEARGARG